MCGVLKTIETILKTIVFLLFHPAHEGVSNEHNNQVRRVGRTIDVVLLSSSLLLLLVDVVTLVERWLLKGGCQLICPDLVEQYFVTILCCLERQTSKGSSTV